MKYEEITGMTAAELINKKNDLRQQLFDARMKNSLGQLTNPMIIRHLRRDIARLNTALVSKASTVAKG